MRSRFKSDPQWIIVCGSARCAEPNCQTKIKCGDAAFRFPSEGTLYGARCGHGEKVEREFATHRLNGTIAAERRGRLLRTVLYVVAAALIGAFIGQIRTAGITEADWIEAIQSADTN